MLDFGGIKIYTLPEKPDIDLDDWLERMQHANKMAAEEAMRRVFEPAHRHRRGRGYGHLYHYDWPREPLTTDEIYIMEMRNEYAIFAPSNIWRLTGITT